MSTFLELCQDLRQEATDSGTGPSTVVSQTGELSRFVKWVKDSWVDLQQSREDWRWMRREFTVSTVADDGEYPYTACTDTLTAAAISRFARWYEGTDPVMGLSYFKAYLSSAGVAAEYPLIWQNWDTFRRIYRFGTQTSGQPAWVSVDPQLNIVLGPKPSAIYVVSGVYQIGPQIMTLDADVPEMPSRFHRLITYEALSRYGGNRVAPEAMLRAASEGGALRSALELTQIPRMTFGEPLA